MFKPIISLCLFLSVSVPAFAFDEVDCCQRWVIDGALGMAFYSAAVDKEPQVATGRLSVGRILATQTYWQAAIELGLQSGNTLALRFPKEAIDALGGVEIEATIKPMLDGLVSIRSETLIEFPLFSWVKAGVSYREMTVDKAAVNTSKGFSPEVMAGLGFQINEQAVMRLGYQYIHGQNPTLSVDEVNESATLRHLPAQQALLLGFSYQF